jgi:hypothetical protein
VTSEVLHRVDWRCVGRGRASHTVSHTVPTASCQHPTAVLATASFLLYNHPHAAAASP